MRLGGQSLLAEAHLIPFHIQWPGVGCDSPSRRVKPVEDDLFSLADLDDVISGGGDLEEIVAEEEEDSYPGYEKF